MKTRIILICLTFFLATSVGFAQKNKPARSIINPKVGIKGYHNKEDLERMPKGQLLTLYVERIESLVKLLPYIAFATKPGVTMETLGIPTDKDNTEALDNQYEETANFLATNTNFQKRILPYSDKSDLVAAILFYEETLKSLHEYSEFH